MQFASATKSIIYINGIVKIIKYSTIRDFADESKFQRITNEKGERVKIRRDLQGRTNMC